MHRSGFTLIEMLISVTVLVILGLIILTQLNPLTQIFKGYDTVRKTDLAKLKAAFESYYEDHGCYPPSTILDNCGGSDLQPYMDEIPCDPETRQPYTMYSYPTNSGCYQNFVIYANLVNVFDPQANDIPYCSDTYAVTSSGINQSIVISGCSGRTICHLLYGCVQGSCTLIAQDSIPSCYPNYCGDSNCNNKCANPNYECKAY